MTESRDNQTKFKSGGETVLAHPVEGDDTKGIVTAVVSVFDIVDSAGDVTVYGKTFSKQITEGKTPYVVWSHRWDQPIGKVLSWKEVPANSPELPEHLRAYGGLIATMQLNLEKQLARDVYSDLVGGYIKEWSYGYRTLKEERVDGKNFLLEVDVKEISPVLVGCCPETATTEVKSVESSPSPSPSFISKQEFQLLLPTQKR